MDPSLGLYLSMGETSVPIPRVGWGRWVDLLTDHGCCLWLEVIGRSGRCAGAVVVHVCSLRRCNVNRFDLVAGRLTPRKILYHYLE